MTDKRMLILPSELVKKIDDNRGDMSQADFLDYLIESHMGSNWAINRRLSTFGKSQES